MDYGDKCYTQDINNIGDPKNNLINISEIMVSFLITLLKFHINDSKYGETTENSARSCINFQYPNLAVLIKPIIKSQLADSRKG